MKVGTKFKIGYRAKKYNDEFIWREGIWTDECRMWTDKSGQDKYTTEVVIQGYGGELKLIGGKSSGGSKGSEAPPAKESSFDDLDDEIPF